MNVRFFDLNTYVNLSICLGFMQPRGYVAPRQADCVTIAHSNKPSSESGGTGLLHDKDEVVCHMPGLRFTCNVISGG